MSVARPQGLRGAGFGNEVFTLAKAIIGAQLLDAKLVEQPWWLNRRRYGPTLGYNFFPPLHAQVAAMRRPLTVIGDDSLADRWDYEASLSALADSIPTHAIVYHASGMTGGYLAIRPAREYMAQRVGFQPTSSDGSVRIGVHIRRGDFDAVPIRPGIFNTQLPMTWTSNALLQVIAAVGGNCEVLIHTDGPPDAPELVDLVALVRPVASVRIASGTFLEDLRTLASSDFIVPSVSSFSTLAIFLSEAAYVWPTENLNQHGKWLSVWGHLPEVWAGPTGRALSVVESANVEPTDCRALPVSAEVPNASLNAWVQAAMVRGGAWPIETDLIYYGVTKGNLT